MLAPVIVRTACKRCRGSGTISTPKWSNKGGRMTVTLVERKCACQYSTVELRKLL